MGYKVFAKSWLYKSRHSLLYGWLAYPSWAASPPWLHRLLRTPNLPWDNLSLFTLTFNFPIILLVILLASLSSCVISKEALKLYHDRWIQWQSSGLNHLRAEQWYIQVILSMHRFRNTRLTEILTKEWKYPRSVLVLWKVSDHHFSKGYTSQAWRLTICHRRLSFTRRREGLCPKSHSASH